MRACGSGAEQLRCLSCSIFVRIKESVIRSAMSSPCWSPPHLLPSSPPQHEAPPGQHDILQDDTVHRASLPKPIRSTSSADEPPSHFNYESSGNPRNTSPTGRAIGILSILQVLTIGDFFSEQGHVSIAWKKTSSQPTGSVNSTPTKTARTELHSMITFHHANTRGSRAAKLRIAHHCVPKTIVIHVPRPIPQLTLTTTTSSL